MTSWDARRLLSSALVIDAHAHPSLKTTLFGLRLHRRHSSGRAFNPFTLRTDLPKTRQGGVDVIVNSHYLPERGLLDDCRPLRWLAKISPGRIRRLFSGDPFERTIDLIDDFEAAVARSNRVGPFPVRVARSADEAVAIVGGGATAVVHAVEGAHSLAGSVDNLGTFADRGVCMLTLAHFYANEVVAPVVGIPPKMRRFGCFRAPKDPNLGLGPLGPPAIEEMLRLGMVVDLTHCTPRARAEAFELCRARRPLVFSHVGVQPLADDPMSPTPDEIRRVADSGGVVGVIFMNHWLGHRGKDGIDRVVATIRSIESAGGIDAVALGSDFDGFTDPPDDLVDPSDLPLLTEALLADGFCATEVEKILGRNMLRVLRDGWR